MKKLFLLLGFFFLMGAGTFAQFSFYLIDNFEVEAGAATARWWNFGNIKMEVVPKPASVGQDLIAESCGKTSLSLSGKSTQWYVGGIGTDLDPGSFDYSRFQIDLFGDGDGRGKLIIELFDDDNQNFSIEQDPENNYAPIYDDKWIAEVNIQGEGFTRVSIPFSAFREANPNVGDDIWNPRQEDGSGGLLKLQMVAISDKKEGEIRLLVDNILLTY